MQLYRPAALALPLCRETEVERQRETEGVQNGRGRGGRVFGKRGSELHCSNLGVGRAAAEGAEERGKLNKRCRGSL